MSEVNELKIEGNQIITEKSQITLANLDPKNQKVIIWGYELCNGAEWKDFLNVVNKLGKDKADLEAKLVECEENLALCEELRNVEENEYSKDIGKTNSALLRKCKQTSRLIEENKQLKQQLVEKEKEIENRLNYQKDLRKINNDLEFEINDTKQLVKDLKRKHNQDKISFAVEKLKEVKKLFKEKYTYDVEESDFAVIYEDDIDEIIDNQIEQLKKEIK